MKERLLCRLLGLHKYEILKEEKLQDKRGIIIGNIIISRCTICGNIKQHKSYTEYEYN